MNICDTCQNFTKCLKWTKDTKDCKDYIKDKSDCQGCIMKQKICFGVDTIKCEYYTKLDKK